MAFRQELRRLVGLGVGIGLGVRVEVRDHRVDGKLVLAIA